MANKKRSLQTKTNDRWKSSTQIIASEKSRHGELGKYTERITHNGSAEKEKIIGALDKLVW